MGDGKGRGESEEERGIGGEDGLYKLGHRQLKLRRETAQCQPICSLCGNSRSLLNVVRQDGRPMEGPGARVQCIIEGLNFNISGCHLQVISKHSPDVRDMSADPATPPSRRGSPSMSGDGDNFPDATERDKGASSGGDILEDDFLDPAYIHLGRKGKSTQERAAAKGGKVGNHGRFKGQYAEFLEDWRDRYNEIRNMTAGKLRSYEQFWSELRVAFWNTFPWTEVRKTCWGAEAANWSTVDFMTTANQVRIQ